MVKKKKKLAQKCVFQALFLNRNGHIKLIHIIKEGRTEKMLTRAIKLLKGVSELVSEFDF